jgi:EAL domain-containing protein (putative c-di-GMP-specific phosphodiesterase class I)
VLATACRDTLLLGPGSRMSVNVSGRQLRHGSLVTDVADALKVSGLPPAQLILEITETATAGEGEAQTTDNVTTLLALKEMGVGLALDDFGTGFSPLSHLRRFPVDLLKIDRSFVAGMTTSRHDAAIVRGVVDLAHALEVRVVAEGVERPEQLAALLSLGCDLGQGYLWRRPASIEEVADPPVPASVPRQPGEPLHGSATA